MSGFYRAFEERHRGPRELIKGRLKVYLPFLTPLLHMHHRANGLDLGCGRGEWLELLQDTGFDAQGIDLDEGMLDACRELSLPVSQGEAVSSLKAMNDESYLVISGFHIVEHISFNSVQELVKEALRVLRPGGLLILETPNPENIVVGTANFYTDPSHLQPIPPNLLAFIPEHQGFTRTKIIRLQEPEELISKQDISLLDVLSGVSPDYAVVAQKWAEKDVLRLTDEAFSRELGLDLYQLAERYHEGLRSTLARIEGQVERSVIKADTAEIKAQKAEARAQEAELMAQCARGHAQEAELMAQRARGHAQEAENLIVQAEALLTSITNSRSWRYTQPLRASGTALRLLQNSTKHSLKAAIQPSVDRMIRLINSKPQLREPALAWIKKHPQLDQAIYGFSSRNRSQDQQSSAKPGSTKEQFSLSPRARRIYTELKSALDKNYRGII